MHFIVCFRSRRLILTVQRLEKSQPAKIVFLLDVLKSGHRLSFSCLLNSAAPHLRLIPSRVSYGGGLAGGNGVMAHGCPHRMDTAMASSRLSAVPGWPGKHGPRIYKSINYWPPWSAQPARALITHGPCFAWSYLPSSRSILCQRTVGMGRPQQSISFSFAQDGGWKPEGQGPVKKKKAHSVVTSDRLKCFIFIWA